MKSIKFIFITAIMLIVSSCEKQNASLKFNKEPPEDTVDLPCYVNLSDDKWMGSAYSHEGNFIWSVKETTHNTYEYNGTIVSEGTQVLLLNIPEKTPETASPGVFEALYIGNKSWSNYKFSFDFYIGEDKVEPMCVEFSVFNNYTGKYSIIDNGKPIVNDVTKNFVFSLSRTDGLEYEELGAFDNNFRYMDIKGGLVVLPEIGVWHNVVLELYGLNLHLMLDGKDYGEIVRYKEKPFGGVVLSGSNNICYKNISIIPYNE